MKIRILTLSLVLFAASLSLVGQDRPRIVAALDTTSTFADFTQVFDDFSKRLLKSDKSVRGFIALTAGADEIATRYKYVRLILRKNKKLNKRLEIFRPGTQYRGAWTQTEFWLLPKRNKSPYVANTADYFCRPLEISGEHTVGLDRRELNYTASYPTKTWLDTPYTFKWTVKGGKIISGQGTPQISVRRSKRLNNTIVVSLKIGGGDEEDESCKRTAEFVTQFVKQIEPL
jgi:hypothetical protein